VQDQDIASQQLVPRLENAMRDFGLFSKTSFALLSALRLKTRRHSPYRPENTFYLKLYFSVSTRAWQVNSMFLTAEIPFYSLIPFNSELIRDRFVVMHLFRSRALLHWDNINIF